MLGGFRFLFSAFLLHAHHLIPFLQLPVNLPQSILPVIPQTLTLPVATRASTLANPQLQSRQPALDPVSLRQPSLPDSAQRARALFGQSHFSSVPSHSDQEQPNSSSNDMTLFAIPRRANPFLSACIDVCTSGRFPPFPIQYVLEIIFSSPYHTSHLFPARFFSPSV